MAADYGSHAAHAALQERMCALQTGASVIYNNWPSLKANVSIFIGPNMLAARAAFMWPGVVRVTLRYSGELVAQSMPGRPFELDRAAT